MRNENECLLKSIKAKGAGRGYGVLAAFSCLCMFASFGFAVIIEEESHYNSDADVLFKLLLIVAVFMFICMACALFTVKYISQTEIKFLENCIECKACIVSSLFGPCGGLTELNIKYQQVETVTQAGDKMMYISVSGKRYAIAMENMEECRLMLKEMKRRI